MEDNEDFEDWLIAREECISDEWYRRMENYKADLKNMKLVI